MEKRVILAIALSMLILMVWSNFVAKPIAPPGKEAPVSVVKPSEQQIAPILTNNSHIEPEQPRVEFLSEKMQIFFDESQAAIKEVFFKDFKNYKFTIAQGFLLQGESLEFKLSKNLNNEIEFVHSGEGKKIYKRFIFSNNNYDLHLEIDVQNDSSNSLNFNPQLIVGLLGSAINQEAERFQDFLIVDKEKISRPSLKKDSFASQIKFVGLRDRYFCLIVDPEDESYSAFVKKINSKESELGLQLQESIIAPGASKLYKFYIYLGPQELSSINKINSNWSPIINYGTFDVISQVLLKLLGLIQSIVRNWGLAIILFSIVIYVILSPLMVKQLRSMKQMQALQPEIEKLRQSHKDNPQKMNKELIELYRLNKVNPFGGCLPMILQIPIFFALYQALMRSVVLKGASFLWIKDLSEPDRIGILPNALPLIGNEINILPILMAIGMFFQQKMTMSTASGDAAAQQKMMVIIFPIMFGVIFYHMPSGLVLYWFVNSALTMLNQARMMRAK